jgi:hypothetical protein
MKNKSEVKLLIQEHYGHKKTLALADIDDETKNAIVASLDLYHRTPPDDWPGAWWWLPTGTIGARRPELVADVLLEQAVATVCTKYGEKCRAGAVEAMRVFLPSKLGGPLYPHDVLGFLRSWAEAESE